MKLKTGMYVRTNLGIIAQLTRVFKFENKTYFLNYCNSAVNCSSSAVIGNKGKILKASFDIIDLIQVGDVVLGKDGHKFEVYAIGSNCVYINNLKEFIFIDEVESIATKEQFENISYKVGE